MLDYFSKYYFALFGTVDPEAAKLPLPPDKLGRLLTYVVAHEVGHTLGLRHNHIASTAYSVEDMRNAALANEPDPTARSWPMGASTRWHSPATGYAVLLQLGPYDFAAIAWGYGQFSATPQDENATLAKYGVGLRDRSRTVLGGRRLPAEIKDYSSIRACSGRIRVPSASTRRSWALPTSCAP